MHILKGSNILGLKVIAIKNGKKINKVEDIVYDSKENKVKALLIDKGGWFEDAKVILLQDIKNIGRDAVLIESEDQITRASKVSDSVKNIAKGDEYLTKTRVVTEEGNELGNVSDIFFDIKTGNVLEIEVSQGIKNIRSGKKRVKFSDIISVGEDVTIVKAYAEEEFERQSKYGGIQGMITAFGKKFPEVTERAKEKTKEIFQEARDRAEILAYKAKYQVEEMKKHPKIKKDLSKYAKDLKGQYRQIGALGGRTKRKKTKFKTKNARR